MSSLHEGFVVERIRVGRVVGTRGRKAAFAAAALASAIVVTGCGPTLAGSAAVVGEARITDDELTAQVTEVLTALNLGPSDKANQVVLDRLIRESIFAEMAKREQVDVSDGEVSAFVAESEKQTPGGAAGLAAQLLQAGVPQSEILPFAKTYLLQQKIAMKLAPNKAQQIQQQVFSVAAIKLSESLDIRVSPRFGSWEAAQLKVGAIPNDLSVPAPDQKAQLSRLLPQQ